MTFDVPASHVQDYPIARKYIADLFGICRRCNDTVIFRCHRSEHYGLLRPGGVHDIIMESMRPLNSQFERIELKIVIGIPIDKTPEFLPDNLKAAFDEGAMCLRVDCYNAAASMFRLCIDLATKQKLPLPDAGEPQPNSRQRRDLGGYS